MGIALASRERDRDGMSDVVRHAVALGFPPLTCLLVDDSIRARELAEILLARGPLIGVEIMTLEDAAEALDVRPSPIERALAAHALAVERGILERDASPRRALELARWLDERVAAHDAGHIGRSRCPVAMGDLDRAADPDHPQAADRESSEVESGLIAAYQHAIGATGACSSVRAAAFAARAGVNEGAAPLRVACEAMWWRDPRWPAMWTESSRRGVELVIACPDEEPVATVAGWLAGSGAALEDARSPERTPSACAITATLDDSRLDEVERVAETLRWEIAHGLDPSRAVIVAPRVEAYRSLILEVLPRAALSVAAVESIPLDRTPAGRLALDALELVAEGFRLPALLRFVGGCDEKRPDTEREAPRTPQRAERDRPRAQWLSEEWARANGDWDTLLGRLRSTVADEDARPSRVFVIAVLDALDRLVRPAPPVELAHDLVRLLAGSGALRVLARAASRGPGGVPWASTDARERTGAIAETLRRVETVARWLTAHDAASAGGSGPPTHIGAADLLAPLAIALSFPGPLVAAEPDAVRFVGLGRLASLSRVERLFVVGLDDDAALGPTSPRTREEVEGWLVRMGAAHVRTASFSAPRRHGDRELLAPVWLAEAARTTVEAPCAGDSAPAASAPRYPTRTYALDRQLGAASRRGTLDAGLLAAATRPGGRPRSAALLGAWVEAVRRSRAPSPYAGWLAGTRAWEERAEAPVWSATKLERYALCPFRYFAHDVLRIREAVAPGREVPPLDVGTIMHEALCRAGRELREGASRAAADALACDHDDAIARATREVETIVGGMIRVRYDALDQYAPVFRERRKEQALARLAQFIAHELAAMNDANTRLVPRYFELAFGMDRPGVDLASNAPLEVPGTGVWLTGSIDRIDVVAIELAANATGSDEARAAGPVPALAALICDYKSGKVPDDHHIPNGLGFQLPVYLLIAAPLLAARGVGPPAVAFAARYFQVKSPIEWGWKGGVWDRDRARSVPAPFAKGNALDAPGFAQMLDAYRESLVALTARRARGNFATGAIEAATMGCRVCPYASCCRADPNVAAWRARDVELGVADDWLPRRILAAQPDGVHESAGRMDDEQVEP